MEAITSFTRQLIPVVTTTLQYYALMPFATGFVGLGISTLYWSMWLVSLFSKYMFFKPMLLIRQNIDNAKNELGWINENNE